MRICDQLATIGLVTRVKRFLFCVCVCLLMVVAVVVVLVPNESKTIKCV